MFKPNVITHTHTLTHTHTHTHTHSHTHNTVNYYKIIQKQFLHFNPGLYYLSLKEKCNLLQTTALLGVKSTLIVCETEIRLRHCFIVNNK